MLARPGIVRAESAARGASSDLSGARRVVIAAAAAILLAGPTVLSFLTGGYFDVPREWAGLIAWGLVVVAVAILPRPFVASRPAVLATGGLALFAAWTLLSTIWAPIAGLAYTAGQLVALYLGVLLAATALLSVRGAERLAEPALATGILVVIGYGLSERMVPGLLHFARSLGAQGRLEQPLTYWNAMGELGAIGIVLAARIAGDTTRGPRLRIAAAMATAPLGMGLYLSFSRGALFACAAGLVALIVVAPHRQQLRAVLLAIATAVLAAAAAAPFSVITTLTGAESTRERDGLVVLALLLVIAAVSAVVQHRLVAGAAEGGLALPRRAGWIALAVVLAGLAVAVVSGAKENSASPLAAGASRLTTLQSDRYSYWRVAMDTFDQQPLRGVGAGAWSVAWVRLRPHNVGAQDAHSLPLQTMAELGVVGLILLLTFLGGVSLAARRALHRSPALAAGPIAGVVAYVAHSPLDWDWQMPALTLVAIVLAGLLVALSSAPDEAAAPYGRGSAGDVNRPASPGSVAGRVTFVMLAVVACAWFALGVRAFREVASVNRLLGGGARLTAVQAHAARAELDRASLLNPDQEINFLRAQVAERSGDRDRALMIAEILTRREPQNVNAWLLVSILTKPGSAAYQQAEARLRALAPPVPQ